MNIPSPEPDTCSQCGSINHELFSRATLCGIRCLNCGHEAITKMIEDKPENPVGWNQASFPKRTF